MSYDDGTLPTSGGPDESSGGLLKWCKENWWIILIVAILIIIGIIVAVLVNKDSDTSDSCGPNQMKNPCGQSGCIDKCTNQKQYDCKTNSCICIDLTKQCGDICCKDEEGCDKGICKKLCGSESKMCENNQICQETISKDNNKTYNCVLQNSNFSNSRQLPKPIENEQPCYQVDTGFCTSNDPDSTLKHKCFQYHDKNNCNDTDCNWWNLLEKANSIYQSDGNFNKLELEYANASLKQPEGFYCNPDSNQSYHRIIASKKSDNVDNCVTQLGNSSVSNVLWDEESKTCFSLQNCSSPDELKKCPYTPEHNKKYNYKYGEDGQIYVM